MNYEQSAKAQTERLMADGHATILAIESSCDETAAAIVRDGRQVISSVISSQIPLHAMYGGVVPEIASRRHMEAVVRVTEQALKDAEMDKHWKRCVIRAYKDYHDKSMRTRRKPHS